MSYIIGPPDTFGKKTVKICHRKCRPFEQQNLEEVEIE